MYHFAIHFCNDCLDGGDVRIAHLVTENLYGFALQDLRRKSMTREKKSETLASLRITPSRAEAFREALEYYDLDRPAMADLVLDALIYHHREGHSLCLPLRFAMPVDDACERIPKKNQ
jgi:hypothetical protein